MFAAMEALMMTLFLLCVKYSAPFQMPPYVKYPHPLFSSDHHDTADHELKPVKTHLNVNGFLEIKLNRPKKFNSLDTEMLTTIRDALDEALGDGSRPPACAGILLSAVEGRAFCAGGDIKHVAALKSPRERVRRVSLERRHHQQGHSEKPVPDGAVGFL